MAFACCEIIWLIALLKDLRIEITKPVKLMCDNESAIHLTKNPVFHERTKHIEVDCHFIREKIIDKKIEIEFIRSENQLADIFTKAVSSSNLMKSMVKMNITNPYVPLEGEYWKFMNKKANKDFDVCNIIGSNCKEFKSIGEETEGGNKYVAQLKEEKRKRESSIKRNSTKGELDQSDYNVSSDFGMKKKKTRSSEA